MWPMQPQIDRPPRASIDLFIYILGSGRGRLNQRSARTALPLDGSVPWPLDAGFWGALGLARAPSATRRTERALRQISVRAVQARLDWSNAIDVDPMRSTDRRSRFLGVRSEGPLC